MIVSYFIILTSGKIGVVCAETRLACVASTLGAGNWVFGLLLISDCVSFLITIVEDSNNSFFLRLDPENVARLQWLD